MYKRKPTIKIPDSLRRRSHAIDVATFDLVTVIMQRYQIKRGEARDVAVNTIKNLTDKIRNLLDDPQKKEKR